MFALISTMNNSSDVLGRIISVHRTPRAAGIANAKRQRQCEKNNGQNCFVPTTVRIVPARCRVGTVIYRGEGGTMNDIQSSEYNLADYCD